MRKLRVALVILLLLALIMASYAVSAKSSGDALSIAKSRATLQNIEKKLVSGNSDIEKMSQELSAYTMDMAARSIANVPRAPGANKTKSTIKPPSTKGYGMPMGGIGGAIKALGSIHMDIKAPVDIAKNIDVPRLAVMADKA